MVLQPHAVLLVAAQFVQQPGVSLRAVGWAEEVDAGVAQGCRIRFIWLFAKANPDIPVTPLRPFPHRGLASHLSIDIPY
jgi:hypothetical protein